MCSNKNSTKNNVMVAENDGFEKSTLPAAVIARHCEPSYITDHPSRRCTSAAVLLSPMWEGGRGGGGPCSAHPDHITHGSGL